MIFNCLTGNHFKKITYQQIGKSPAGAFLITRAYQKKELVARTYLKNNKLKILKMSNCYYIEDVKHFYRIYNLIQE